MLPVLMRARANLAANNGEDAIAEFQKIVKHRGLMSANPEGALARLGLARAYALSGNTAMARAKYQEFLDLWKDADPDIPVFKEAKAEYTRFR